MASNPEQQPDFFDESNPDLGPVMINGRYMDQLPQDLYIPPQALRVFLENFEGPLDLLLYLIKQQNFDILSIPIMHITRQYMQYIELMQELEIELASEYLLMAAMLAQIKSRMLLPVPSYQEEEDDDPRAELIRQLQAYEQFKQAADYIEQLPRQERDFIPAQVVLAKDWPSNQKPWPSVELQQLQQAMNRVLTEQERHKDYQVRQSSLSVRERMSKILQYLQAHSGFIALTACFTKGEGRQGLVVSFVAVLELLRHSAIDIVQSETDSMFYLRMHHHE